MNKKFIKILIIGIMTVIAIPAFTACQKGNENLVASSPSQASVSSAAESDGDKVSAAGSSRTESLSSAQQIVGKWTYDSGNYTYDFKEDGSGIYDASGTVMKFKYELKDNRISILYEGKSNALILEYELDGDTLNIKDSFGNDTIYKRK